MRTVSSKHTSPWMGMEILFLLLIAIFSPPPPGLAQGVPGAPVITQQPQDIFAAEGGSARFSVEATGESLTYQWFYRAQGAPDFQPLPDQTQPSLLLTSLRVSQEGFYRAVVSNPRGSTPTAPALLAVYPNATRVELLCRDGKPITNACVVTITLTNSIGYSEPKTSNVPLGFPNDNWYWTCFFCQSLDPSAIWWFMVTASCCTNVWIVPTTQCYGDFGPLICDSCGDCPKPQINCPTSIELLSPCGQCVTHNYSNPSVINGNLVACNPPPGSCFPVGATTVTCTATNKCGDVASCEFPIIVRSCLKCPPSRIYECGRRWDFDLPTVEPGCAGIQVGVLSTVTNGICPQTITRTWSVVMDCGGGLGQVTQCSQTVTVVDTTPPIIACAPDKSVACGSDWSFDPPSVADDGCSPIKVQVLNTVTNSPCTTQTAIVRTWIATDACGNSTTCSQTVYIDQTGPPVVSCPQDKNVDCGADWSFDRPVIISSCSPVSIRVLNTETNGSCPVRITRTWMIDNQCGHVVECSQTVTVLNASLQTVFTLFSGRDSSGLLPLGAQDPQFTFGCLPPNMGPTTPVVTTPHPLWIPNGPQSQWIGPSLSNFGPGGTYCYQVEFNLPTCPSGQPKYGLTGRWAGDDSGGIHLNGSSTGNFLPNGWAFTNWHPISITSGLVPGPNLLTFYVTNGSAGPTGLRVELAVTALCCGCTNPCVVDIRCPGNITNTICGTSGIVKYLAPTASSSCGPITNLVCVPPSASSFPLGTTTVTCTATDAQGHSASCSFQVTMIRHQTPWTLTCPPLHLDVTGCPPLLPNLFALATVTTNCPIPGGLTWTNYGPGNVVLTNGSPLPPGQTVVILRVCDGAGNCKDCDVIITAIYPPGCCEQPCELKPQLSLFTGRGPSGLLPAGSPDTQFSVGQPPFTGPNPFVPSSINWFWIPNSAASQWITPYATYTGGPATEFSYTNRFFLCSTNKAQITGQWAADDSGEILLNGSPTGNVLPSGWAFLSWTPVSITSGFVPGWNELVFRTTNGLASSVTGLRAELRGRACCNSCVYITCPADILTNTCSAGANVSWIMPLGVGSHCGSLASVTCNPPSGSYFPAGANVVNCTATDSCGNAATCSFTVTVRSTSKPVELHCPPNISVTTCFGSAVVNYVVGATGNVGPITCIPPSGSAFPLGVTTVTCSATNECSSVVCSFKVKVKPYQTGPGWWNWPCDPPTLAHGLPLLPQPGTILAVGGTVELPHFGPVGPGGTHYIRPAPGTPRAGLAIQTGNSPIFGFTTILDMEAPDGAIVEISDPSDPSGIPLLTLEHHRGTKCYDLKKCKGLISDDEAFRTSAVNPNGELLGSFVQTFNEGNTNAALSLFAPEGVTQFPITLVFDRRDGTISVAFPGDATLRACCRRKGWDGTVKVTEDGSARIRNWDGTVKGRPPEATLVTFSPIKAHPVIDETLHIVTTGHRQWPIIGEAIGISSEAGPTVLVGRVGVTEYTRNGKASPQLFLGPCKGTKSGRGVRWTAATDDWGVSLGLGRSLSVDFAFTHTTPLLAPDADAWLEFRTGRAGSGQPADAGSSDEPSSAFLKFTKKPAGIFTTVDFAYLGATGVHVELWKNGSKFAEGIGSEPGITDASPLVLDRWPTRFSQRSDDGSIRLLGPVAAAGLEGDEVRIRPVIPAGARTLGYLTHLHCVASEGSDVVLDDLKTTTPPQPPLSISSLPPGVSVSWEGEGFRLQGSESVTGPWLDLGDSPLMHVPAHNPIRLFRLTPQ